MAIIKFPPVESADENGLVAIGGDLEIPSLLLAYSSGIFPWPHSEYLRTLWFSPDPRGILEFRNLHLSKSLKKFLKKNTFDIRLNYDFPATIMACANSKNRGGNNQTWITDKMIEAYIDFHYAGHAFSVEAYNSKEELVGGLYGVKLKNFCAGESMFYLEENASKACVVWLMNYLNDIGITWLDTQMVTPVVESLGGIEISRNLFMQKLSASLNKS